MMRMAGGLVAAMMGAAVLTGAAEAQSQGSLRGKIKSYECGDNCYLTIVDSAGREHTGLCAAKTCRPWNEKAEMPKRHLGRSVVAGTGRGTQFDGSGKAMGRMLAFRTLQFR